MSTLVVAKKDFRDAIQSRAMWALLAVFVVLSSLVSYAYAEFPGDVTGAGTGETATVGGLIFFTTGTVSLFITLAAIVVAYKSIAGEREIGSIKLLLALPHTRRDVFFGKVLGRAAVLAVAVAIGLLIGFGLGFGLIGDVEMVPVVVFLLMTLVFAAVFTGIIVAISATTASTSRATTLAIGFFLLLELLWTPIGFGIFYVVNGFSFAGEPGAWFYVVTQFPPSAAYVASLTALLPDVAEALNESTGAEEFDAFYATPEIGFVVLAFWLVVPLAIGYYRFQNADL